MKKRSKIHASQQVIQILHKLTDFHYNMLPGRASAGIWALLRAWDFHDRVVLLPANTCYIVLWAVLKSGNHPLLVDVDPRTANLTVANLDATLMSNPAVVIPSHMYGLPAPMSAICQWAQTNGLKVIEDAALALGATVDGRPAGTWGDAAVFSFGLGKIADNQVGGALVTDDPTLAHEAERLLAEVPFWDDQLMALTNQWNGLYWSLHQYESQNPRLLALYPQLFDLYGDLTVYQLTAADWVDLPDLLRNLPDNLARRAHQTALYDAHLPIDRFLPSLVRPAGSMLWRYPLLVASEQRDDLLAHLWEQGIHDATRWYPSLRPMAAVLAPYISQPPTPAADSLAASIINLPLGVHVDETDILEIAGLINNFMNEITE